MSEILDNNSQEKTNKSPIFIFGSARSGTSLLSRIVGSHPNIAVPFESQLYNTFIPWLKYYGDLERPENRERLVADMLSTEDLLDWTPCPDKQETIDAITRNDFHGVVDALITEWAKKSGKSRWGEKTPWHIYYWKEILQGFPNAKFIHIVRDGRDSSLSWKKARFGPKHIYYLAKRWQDYLEHVEEFKKVVNPENLFELRYEDLLDTPENIIKQLCEFFDEDFSENMLEFYQNKVRYPTDDANLENLTKPLMKENKYKWKSEMIEKDCRIFETVAGDMLALHGYECVVKSPSISVFEQFKIKYLEHPPKRIVSMLKNRKGHIEALRLLRINLRLRLGL